MEENNYYEYKIEEEIDHFQPQTVIDTILDFIVGLTILTCIVLNIIHIKECMFQRKFKKAIEKMR